MTAVANTAFTAAQFNTHVRDNLLECSPAQATAAGRIIVTDGLNSVTERQPTQSAVNTSETTTSTSYTDLATVGPAVSSLATGALAIVVVTGLLQNSSAGAISSIGVDVTGASSVSATDASALRYESGNASDLAQMSHTILYGGLTPGANTFTCKYKCSTGTSTFVNRRLLIIPL